MSIKQEYDKLNKEQALAVNTIEGPVIVKSGPGTGKTQMLALRIAKILESDVGMNPYNILCLTYTNSGVVSMRKRLAKFIGTTAYDLHIHTFHSFCKEIIDYNGGYFGVRQMEPADDLNRIDILYEIISEIDHDNPLKRYKGDLNYEAKRLTSLFNTMKGERWTPEYIEDACKRYIDDLPNREEFIYKRGNSKANPPILKGDVKLNAIAAEQDKLKYLVAGAHLLPEYNKKMKEAGLYDFQDMINWVVDVFRDEDSLENDGLLESGGLLHKYQEQYQYILVDEFQDTSGAQFSLLKYLIEYWDEPNIFVVGDMDQCIYEFAGARAKNVEDFVQKYSSSITAIQTVNNYRSAQGILDSAHNLIKLNSGRDGQQGLNAFFKEAADLQVHQYNSILQEEARVYEVISNLLANGVAPSEIAVIYRNHNQGERIIDVCNKKGIAVTCQKSVNVLDTVIVKQLINLLKYFSLESERKYSGEWLLFQIMHYDFVGLSPDEITDAIYENKDPESSKRLRDYIDPHPVLKFFIRHWTSRYHNEGVLEFIETMARETGLLKYVVDQNKKDDLRYIESFYKWAGEECRKDTSLTIKNLLFKIDRMNEQTVSIASMKDYSADGVEFMSAHGSKGLEFEYVFMIGCTADKWEKKRKGMNSYSMPDTLTFTESTVEGDRRLFYVAMTRAKKMLYISYSLENNDGKPLSPSQFVLELDQPINEIEGGDVSKFIIDTFNPISFKSLLIDDVKLDEKLDNYRLSPSHLNSYIKCPTAFLYEVLLGVPRKSNSSSLSGTAIHAALEQWYNNARTMGEQPLDVLQGYFDKAFKRYYAQMSKEEFKIKYDMGMESLKDYYHKFMVGSNLITLNEFNSKDIKIGDVPIKIVIDKIEFLNTDRDIWLRDYKAGKVSTIQTEIKGATAKNPMGGSIWRQLNFYWLAMIHMNKAKYPYNAVGVSVDLIDPKESQQLEVESSHTDLAIVKEMISDTYKKIKAKDFEESCGECDYCKLQKGEFI